MFRCVIYSYQRKLSCPAVDEQILTNWKQEETVSFAHLNRSLIAALAVHNIMKLSATSSSQLWTGVAH